MVIAMIEDATEMITVEIEIGMTTDMIQDTMIEKNLEEMKTGIIIGIPTDHLGIVADHGTVVNGDVQIVSEMAVIHANIIDTVENEIVVLIKEGDILHQDIMMALIEKITEIEDTHLMKG